MPIDEVRRVIGITPKTFFKSPEALLPADAFSEFGIHIYYKEPGVCEAIEMGLAADPTFHGWHLIERPSNEILTRLQTLDSSIEIDESGFTCPQLGIGIYAPEFSKKIGTPVEGVIVFEEGYYC